MNCIDFQHNIQRYFVSDLKDQELKDFEAHQSACSVCQKALAQEHAFEALLRKHVCVKEAPQDLREAVLSSIEKQSSRSPLQNIFAVFQNPMFVGSLASIVIVVGVLALTVRSEVLFAGAVSEHQIILAEAPRTDVSGRSFEDVLAQLNQDLDYHVERPHLDLAKVRFLDAKVVSLKDRKVAQFIYEKDGQIISAFAMSPDILQTAKLDGQVMMESDQGRVTAKNEKGFEEVLCFHKKTKGGCLFVSNIPRDEFIKLMG